MSWQAVSRLLPSDVTATVTGSVSSVWATVTAESHTSVMTPWLRMDSRQSLSLRMNFLAIADAQLRCSRL